jgi:hypothetical protein
MFNYTMRRWEVLGEGAEEDEYEMISSKLSNANENPGITTTECIFDWKNKLMGDRVAASTSEARVEVVSGQDWAATSSFLGRKHDRFDLHYDSGVFQAGNHLAWTTYGRHCDVLRGGFDRDAGDRRVERRVHRCHPVDWQAHNTYFVVGHIHYVLNVQ